MLSCSLANAQAPPRQDVIQVCAAEGHVFHQTAVNVISEAYRRLGYQVEYTWLPTRRSLILANTGACDAEIMRVGGVEKQFENLVPVPMPVAELVGVAFMAHTPEVGGPAINGWQDIRNLRTYIILGEVFAEQATKRMTVGHVSTYEQLFTMLEKGHIDVGIGIQLVGEVKLARHFPNSTIHAHGEPLVRTPMFHYVHKNNAHLIPKLEGVLSQMAGNGEIERLNAMALKRLINKP